MPSGQLNVPNGQLNVPNGRQNVPNGQPNVPNGRLNVPNGRPNVPNGRSNVPNGRPNVPNERLNVPNGRSQGPYGPSQGTSQTTYCAINEETSVLTHAVAILSQQTRPIGLTPEKTRGCNPLSGGREGCRKFSRPICTEDRLHQI